MTKDMECQGEPVTLMDPELVKYLLEPFAFILVGGNNADAARREAFKRMQHPEYRKGQFMFSITAPDSAVKALNALMQYYFTRSPNAIMSQKDANQSIKLLGNFFLELRKCFRQDTKLDRFDMLGTVLSDLDSYRKT